VPPELAIIAVTALLAGLLLVGVMLAGRRLPGEVPGTDLVEGSHGMTSLAPRTSPMAATPEREPRAAEPTLRLAWWLTIAIVLIGVGISGSFSADQVPIFLIGALAFVAVVVLHELPGHAERGRLLRMVEVVAAVALIGGLLALTGFASSPFAMLFALVAVAAALAYGPRAGLTAAGLATAAFAGVLFADPGLASYGPDDVLRLSIGLGATWLLAFVATAYAGHQRRAVAQAVALSRTDPLTGLFNRSQLFATLEQEVSRTRRSDRGFCVLMIDLDGLKVINDTAGHLRGDEVLRALGSIIRSSIRTVDSAYRYGGDEFVVLLPETDIVGAFVVAEKVRGGAEELGQALGDGEPLTSVSIGLVSHPEDGLSAEELLTAADRAMYQAKKLGKNQISGNPRPRPALLARRSTVVEAAAAPAPAPGAEAVEAVEVAAAEPTLVEPTPVEPTPAEPMGGQPMAAEAPMAEQAAAVSIERDEATPVAVELGPVVEPPSPAAPRPETDESEPDPEEVRRRIATATQSFDPDHQIRRAMDAFLSPIGSEDRPTRDH
jgi:diguanylate cyclase (GGDEF)-like protein